MVVSTSWLSTGWLTVARLACLLCVASTHVNTQTHHVLQGLPSCFWMLSTFQPMYISLSFHSVCISQDKTTTDVNFLVRLEWHTMPQTTATLGVPGRIRL